MSALRRLFRRDRADGPVVSLDRVLLAACLQLVVILACAMAVQAHEDRGRATAADTVRVALGPR